jgi:hypothetical protein
VGTLIVDAASLSIPAAIGGGCFAAVFAGILTVLCIRGGKNIAAH